MEPKLIVMILGVALVLVTVTVYTQSAFAINATGVKGGTPCAHSGDVGQRNPVNITTMTIFVCDD